MTIYGPGKRSGGLQPPSDEVPQKRLRKERSGRSVREEPATASVPTNEPHSGTAFQPLESSVTT